MGAGRLGGGGGRGWRRSRSWRKKWMDIDVMVIEKWERFWRRRRRRTVPKLIKITKRLEEEKERMTHKQKSDLLKAWPSLLTENP